MNCTALIAAPLWQQVIDWLRDEHKIFIEIRFADKALMQYEFFVFESFSEEVHKVIENIKEGDNRKTFDTYQEAREQAVLEAIERLKNKTNESNVLQKE